MIRLPHSALKPSFFRAQHGPYVELRAMASALPTVYPEHAAALHTGVVEVAYRAALRALPFFDAVRVGDFRLAEMLMLVDCWITGAAIEGTAQYHAALDAAADAQHAVTPAASARSDAAAWTAFHAADAVVWTACAVYAGEQAISAPEALTAAAHAHGDKSAAELAQQHADIVERLRHVFGAYP